MALCLGLSSVFYPRYALAGVVAPSINLNASPLILKTSTSYLDNYYPRHASDLSAVGYALGLSGQLASKHQQLWLQTQYEINHQQFSISDNRQNSNTANVESASTNNALEDSFTDYKASLLARFYITHDWSFDANISLKSMDELLGQGIGKYSAVSGASNRAKHTQVGGAIMYGADHKKRLIKLTYLNTKQDYESLNDYADLSDLNKQSWQLGTLFKLSDNTQLQGYLEYETIDFESIEQPDNTVYRLFAGVNWQSTGRSFIDLLVGGYQRSYDLLPSKSGLLWQLGINYMPLDYVSIELETNKTSIDGVDENAVNTVITQLNSDLMYHYKTYLKLGFTYGINDSDSQSANTTEPNLARSRLIKEQTAGLKGQYNYSEHTLFYLQLLQHQLDDDALDLDITQNKVQLDWHYDF